MDTITAEYDISEYCMDIDIDYNDHLCTCYGDMCRCSTITNARVSHIERIRRSYEQNENNSFAHRHLSIKMDCSIMYKL